MFAIAYAVQATTDTPAAVLRRTMTISCRSVALGKMIAGTQPRSSKSQGGSPSEDSTGILRISGAIVPELAMVFRRDSSDPLGRSTIAS